MKIWKALISNIGPGVGLFGFEVSHTRLLFFRSDFAFLEHERFGGLS